MSQRAVLTHICQDITRPPRTFAGTFSAAYTGEVDALGPIPSPRSNRQTFDRAIDKQRREKKIERMFLQKAEARSAQVQIQ